MKKEDFTQKLKNTSKHLEPSMQAQQRVWNDIYSKLDSSKFKTHESKEEKYNFSNIFNFINNEIMKIFKSKVFWATVTLGVLSIFFFTPLLFFAVTNSFSGQNLIQEKMMAPMDDDYYMDENYYEYEEEAYGGSDMERKIATDTVVGYIVPEPPIEGDKGYEDTETPGNERVQKRNADIDVTVDNFDESYQRFNDKVIAVGGYVVSSGVNKYDTYSYSNVTIRVPVTKFDEMMQFIRTMGTVDSENIQITDKQNELTQIIKKLEETQAKITELEAIKYPTTEQRNELEKLKSQLQTDQLKQQNIQQETDYSTITVYISSGYDEYDDDWSLSDTWENVLDTLTRIIQFWVSAGLWSLVPLLFCLPVFIGLFLLFKFVKFKLGSKKK